MHKKTKGFTLIELLAVIAIIGILAAILLPALLRARAHARHGRWITGIRTSSMIDPDCALFFTFEEGTIDRDAAGNPEEVENLAHGFTGARFHYARRLDGTISGARTTEGRFPGKTALEFDGGDYVEVTDDASLGLVNNLTMEAWIYPIGTGTPGVGGMVLNKEVSYQFARFPDGTIRWAFNNTVPGWAWRNTGFVAPLNQWTHIVITYSPGAMPPAVVIKTYANGVLVHTYNGTGDILPSAHAFRIGGRVLGVQFFDGIICEVAIFDKALSSDEIRTRFEGSRP